MIKITIIVPVYNVENYLHKCIDSIINQTYKDLEIILVNDGSTDNCGKICEEYAKKDERIRVIHKKNEGVSSARNVGIEASSGEYIVFFDADDYVDMNLFYKSFDSFLKSKCDIHMAGLCVDHYKDSHLEKREVFTFGINKQVNLYEMNEIFEKMFGKENFPSACNKIFSADIIKKNNIKFNLECTMYEDLVFVLGYLMSCRNVNISDETYYIYQVVNGNNSIEKRSQNYIFENLKIVCDTLNNFLKLISYKNERKRLNWNLTFYGLGMSRIILLISDIIMEFKKVNSRSINNIKYINGKGNKLFFITLICNFKFIIWLVLIYKSYKRILAKV